MIIDLSLREGPGRADRKGTRSEKQPGGRGCITSTPKSGDFSIFWQKRPKNERDSCMAVSKNAERPYLASRKPSLGEAYFQPPEGRSPVSRTTFLTAG